MRRLRPARTTRSPSERGAVAVEFALVVPVLVMLLLGIVTVGVAYSHKIGIANAVREGARFGATADASSTVAAQWGDNVVQQVRATQLDDPSSETSVCVQLWKVGTGALASKCSVPAGGPVLAVPTTAEGRPKVPLGITGCVVRVIAARPFMINIGFAVWRRVSLDSSVVRYERKDKVTTCQ